MIFLKLLTKNNSLAVKIYKITPLSAQRKGLGISFKATLPQHGNMYTVRWADLL